MALDERETEYHIKVKYEPCTFGDDIDYLTSDDRRAYEELQILKEEYSGHKIIITKITGLTTREPISESDLEKECQRLSKMRKYNPIKSLVKYIKHKIDIRNVKNVKKALIEDLEKEIRRKRDVTLGEAVHNIFNDVDCKLAFRGDSGHARSRISVLNEALSELGIEQGSNVKVDDYLRDY